MDEIPIVKDPDRELPIPSKWRLSLKQLADAIVLGSSTDGPPEIRCQTPDPGTQSISRANIDAYPDLLGPLTDTAWQTSVYVWTQGRWEVLVDLCTSDGKLSDLVLHAKVRETGTGYVIEPGLVYVP